jgi:hypothetical protein
MDERHVLEIDLAVLPSAVAFAGSDSAGSGWGRVAELNLNTPFYVASPVSPGRRGVMRQLQAMQQTR